MRDTYHAIETTFRGEFLEYVIYRNGELFCHLSESDFDAFLRLTTVKIVSSIKEIY
jgi:hypothetical protein